MIGRVFSRCRSDESGAALIEFALVAPVFLLLVFGLMETGYAVYVNGVLQGVVQGAGRSSGLESAQPGQAALDAQVSERILTVVPGASIGFQRLNYENFADIGRPEDFTDLNRNGRYDPNECFSDENGNERWDADVGRGGQGGASDVALYTVTVEYPSFIPVAGAFGLPEERRLTASTTLRNQPFAIQATRQVIQICP